MAMKTAVSMPDEVFQEAEQVACRLGVTRSELYAKAVAAFVETHRGLGVPEALDRVYAERPSRIDPVLARMQAASIPPPEDGEW